MPTPQEELAGSQEKGYREPGEEPIYLVGTQEGSDEAHQEA